MTTEARTSEQPAAATPPVTEQDVGRQPRRVLALYSYGADHPVTVTFDAQFQAVLKRQGAGEAVRYAEYLEPGRFPGESQTRILRDYLRQRYADRKIDVLFCWGVGPLEFFLRHQDELFPGTPIVYYASSLEPLKHLPAPPITGVLNPDAYERTLELALNLHPDATDVFVVSGTPSHDKSIEREAAPQFARFQSRVTLTYLTDLPLDQLLATVRNLPRRSIIFYSRQAHEDPAECCSRSTSLTRSRARLPFPSTRPGDRISALAPSEAWSTIRWPAPPRPRRLSCVSPGARVPGRFPPIAYPRLRRSTRASWPVGASARTSSPPAASSCFGNPTFWARYRGYIIGTGVVLAIQTLLIAGLLVQRARRRAGRSRAARKREALRAGHGRGGGRHLGLGPRDPGDLRRSGAQARTGLCRRR